MRLLAALGLALLSPALALADCPLGHNLITALPAAQQATLQAAADAAPFATGNIWHATRGAEHITVVGTFHLDDPRLAAIAASLTPDIAAAQTLLVEAGPEEEAALKSTLAAHPELLINPGPSLPDTLAPADWARLSLALTARGIPPVFAAKLQPWYLSTILSVPACQLAGMDAAKGLDKRLMAEAAAKGVPIKGLEPHDTLFKMFDTFTQADQIEMLLETLDTTGPLEVDMATTLTDAYFAGQSRLFWEFSRQQMLDMPGADPARVTRLFDLVEQAMMIRRNQAWIPVIRAQAAKGPVVVAVGALHLPGQQGVLNLLQAEGYEVSPW
jgi:uncharacterized protein YbaP (TraB family)